jgi:hypothetical protein
MRKKQNIGNTFMFNEQSQPRERVSIPIKNIPKFKEILIFILNKIGSQPNVGKTVIFKILYFIDFDFYEEHEEQIMGLTYKKSTHGPTPCEFEEATQEMIEAKEIQVIDTMFHGFPQKKYLACREADISHMSAREIEMVHDVISRLASKTAQAISDYSHGDVPWLVATDQETIDYESVFYRTGSYSMREYLDG